jgi:hypothetical protein
LRRDVGKEADNILHTVLGRQQNVQRIANKLESAGMYPSWAIRFCWITRQQEAGRLLGLHRYPT